MLKTELYFFFPKPFKNKSESVCKNLKISVVIYIILIDEYSYTKSLDILKG